MEDKNVSVPYSRVEVKLLKPFPLIRETLERIGIANRTNKKIFPSCYIKFGENDKVFIAHFKELLKEPNLTETDVKRRNTIVFLLEKWGLIAVSGDVKPEVMDNIQSKKIFILSKNQMVEEGWEVVHKVHIKLPEEK